MTSTQRRWGTLLGLACAGALASACGDTEPSAPAPLQQDDDANDDDANDDDGGDDDSGDGSGEPAADDAADDDAAGGPAVNDDAADDAPATGAEPEPTAPAAIAGCGTPSPGLAPMRRLSNEEYRNTLVDLLGDAELVARVTASLPREPVSLGFRNGADSLRVNELLADQYLQAAFELSLAVPDLPGLVPCETTDFDHECAETFIRDFGKQVYRRPLAEPEVQRYADLYQSAIDQGSDFRTSIEWLSAALLSSSNFLFRVELSAPSTAQAIRPSGYEMASRLSYLLWQTMPDEALFLAAESGSLETAEGIETEVRRMMQSEKALAVYEFFEQWLDLDEMDGVSRNPEVYPEASTSLLELFKAENRAFIYGLLTENGTFRDMLSGEFTYANRSLATHYALAEVPPGAEFVRVAAPGRAGVLTQGMMTVHDRPTRTSIVRRGLKIRTDLLCQIVPAPPDTVDLTLPELDGSMTQRERLALHRNEPSCASCHDLIDPLGEIFDGFDALGRARTTDEGGATVTSTGTVRGTGDLDGDYAGVPDFAAALSESQVVQECFVRQAFRFFYGREPDQTDTCTQQQLLQSFAQRDFRIVDLLVGLTRTDQFLYRAAQETP